MNVFIIQTVIMVILAFVIFYLIMYNKTLNLEKRISKYSVESIKDMRMALNWAVGCGPGIYWLCYKYTADNKFSYYAFVKGVTVCFTAALQFYCWYWRCCLRCR